MAMNDEHGCSLCKTAGSENYEKFKMRKKTYYQYDYRHTNGELFTCVAPTLEAARERRDKWLEQWYKKEDKA